MAGVLYQNEGTVGSLVFFLWKLNLRTLGLMQQPLVRTDLFLSRAYEAFTKFLRILSFLSVTNRIFVPALSFSVGP